MTNKENRCDYEKRIAQEYKWEPIPRRNDNYFSDYKKDNTYMWYAGPWIVAELVNNYYVNHRKYDTLEEALLEEKQ